MQPKKHKDKLMAQLKQTASLKIRIILHTTVMSTCKFSIGSILVTQAPLKLPGWLREKLDIPSLFLPLPSYFSSRPLLSFPPIRSRSP